MSYLFIALTLGFLGSFHCLGMCGPIALALPVHLFSVSKKVLAVLFYNFGRVYTYAVFGIISGVIGYSIVLAGFQQLLSVVLGIALIFSVLIPSLKWTITLPKFYYRLSTKFFSQLRSGKLGWYFVSGMLNGILPCGLVYMAFSASLASGDVLKSVLFMAAFGLGTFPMLLALPIVNSYVGLPVRNVMRKTVPIIVGLTGLMLILRGLNLGVPYFSPEIRTMQTIKCHNEQVHSTENNIVCKKVK